MKKITWSTQDLTLDEIGEVLGPEWVRVAFLQQDDLHIAHARAVCRAYGAWDANEREHYAAYRSLANLLSERWAA